MPERRPAAYACEDDARDALLTACQVADAGSFGGAACASMRWHRSGGAGLLITAAPAPGPASSPGVPAILWLPLEDRRDASSGPETPATEEWRLHRDLYLRRTDVEAIIRCRPTYATTLACSPAAARQGIPAYHPDVSTVAGGAVACVDCRPPGSSLRSEPLLSALHGRWACLLQGWGLLACGASLAAATSRAVEVESLARIWWHVLQMER